MRHWRVYGRHDLPWRRTNDPYHILVSEVMLQQTQVKRVIDYYGAFLREFPSFRVLSRATPSAVIRVWQGLGYNRRALMLLQCAKAVVGTHKGTLPHDYEALHALPGIGPYTAGAILAFAYNLPVPMIETNIRRVYLHHLFPRRRSVPDSDIFPLVIRHVARVSSPQRWYSALMDYGSWLATHTPNPNVRSKHYTRQPAFEGSLRQVRGRVVRALVARSRMVSSDIASRTGSPTQGIRKLMTTLEREGFVTRCQHTQCVHNPHWSLR